MIKDNETIEVLYDVKDSGRQVAWKTKRLMSLRIAQAFKRLGFISKYERIINCGGYLEFRRYDDHSMLLHRAWFCKQDKVCMICAWRRSRKTYAHVRTIMDAVEDDYKYIFLTLTCKNVIGKQLGETISKLLLAYKNLCLRQRFQSATHGWLRCLEVTFNWQTLTFHPHLHIVLAVNELYFSSDLYIKQEEWCSMWKSVLRVDYTPIVDVRVFSAEEKTKGKEISEVAKYCVKPSHIMANLYDIKSHSQDIQDEVKKYTDSITDDIVSTLDSALRGRRLLGFGGVFKEKHKLLNLCKRDDDLIRAGNGKVLTGSSGYEIEKYRWDTSLRNYVKIKDKGDTS
ncbi:MAG: protein rep [Oscillospiraceae bacterium]|nr:protein rep [Oscillospiraceae bacterium]